MPTTALRYPSDGRLPGFCVLKSALYVLRGSVVLFSLTWLLGVWCFAQEISWTPTFENIGVEVVFPSATPENAMIDVEVRAMATGAAFRRAHPLSRIGSTRFAGSLFGLPSGAVYTVRLNSKEMGFTREFRVHTRSDSFAEALAATLHVSPVNGHDANSGTVELPLATLRRALSLATPGTKIVLHGGFYREGDLVVWNSGNAGAPILIENAPGETPILDGTDIGFSPEWELFDGDHQVYRTACAAQPDNAYLDGEHLFRYVELADLLARRWSQPAGFYVDGTHLYARFPMEAAPDGHEVTIPRFTTALSFEGSSHWQIRGVRFQYYGFGTFHRGVYLDGADHVLIDQCEFRNNVVGVGLKRAADFNTVQNCRFSDAPMATWNWHAVKSGGVAYEGGGVVVYSSNEPNRGNVIRDNRFENMFDGASLYSSSLTGPTRDLDFYGNTVSNVVDDAVETDGGGINGRIYRNTFEHFLTGISVAPAFLGPTYITRNILRGWRSTAEFTGYPIKLNVTTSFQTQFVYLYHNTCYTDVPGQNGFLFKNYSNWVNVVSRNNIYVGTDYALESQSSPNPVDFNFDNLTSTHASRFVRWLGVGYSTLNAFSEAVGQEKRGFSVDPLFSDAVGGDFSLRAESPLVDAALRIPGVNDDFVGAGPDVGAVERSP
jgi:hypothetical protein